MIRNFFRRIFILLNIIVALALILANVSVNINPAEHWIFAFFGLAYSYIILVNIIFIFFWLFTKPTMITISLISIIFGYKNINNYFQFNGKSTEEKGINIVSFNVQEYFGGDNNLNQIEHMTKVLNYISELSPDIICLQESNNNKVKNQLDSKKINLPEHFIKMGGHIIISKFPIINNKLHKFEGTTNQICHADIIIKSDTIRIFDCHLQSYYFNKKDISYLDSISFETRDKSIDNIVVYARKLKQGFIKRSEQALKLRELIDDSPYPVIVCGDFNDTPVSYTYNVVIGNDLNDAFVESGVGIGNTYNGKFPSFRIDYILYSKDFKVYNFNIDNVDFSDHYPIYCRLIPLEK